MGIRERVIPRALPHPDRVLISQGQMSPEDTGKKAHISAPNETLVSAWFLRQVISFCWARPFIDLLYGKPHVSHCISWQWIEGGCVWGGNALWLWVPANRQHQNFLSPTLGLPWASGWWAQPHPVPWLCLLPQPRWADLVLLLTSGFWGQQN